VATKASAFALLGPYADWMTPEIGYRFPWQIGGPQALGEEYRWNMPVITYGFDSSFVNYFGHEGVAEVEKAINHLNDLPAVSSLNVSTFPQNIVGRNNLALQGSVRDLKSSALAALLEQLGLADSVWHTFTLRNPDTVLQRNYHPISTAVSSQVNGMGLVYDINEVSWYGVDAVDAIERPVDPLAFDTPGAAGYMMLFGAYLKGLSQDDVGGLRYLYSGENKNVEMLPADVERVDGSPLVNAALRPGVEKIAFQRVPGTVVQDISINLTVEFDDTYIVEGVTNTQRVRRYLHRPDIVFSAGDLGFYSNSTTPKLMNNTGTTNWSNHAALNGSPEAAGPGVIQPGVEIRFSSVLPATADLRWGSYTQAGETFSVYPLPTAGSTGKTALAVWSSETQKKLTWLAIARPQTVYLFQSSSDLLDWQTINVLPATNQMLIPLEAEITAGDPGKFFRVVAE